MDAAMEARTKILVVEDNPLNRELVVDVLEAAGYTVLQAEDGVGILERVKQEQPHLILLDLQLPGMDGFTIARQLAADPATRRIPPSLLLLLLLLFLLQDGPRRSNTRRDHHRRLQCFRLQGAVRGGRRHRHRSLQADLPTPRPRSLRRCGGQVSLLLPSATSRGAPQRLVALWPRNVMMRVEGHIVHELDGRPALEGCQRSALLSCALLQDSARRALKK